MFNIYMPVSSWEKTGNNIYLYTDWLLLSTCPEAKQCALICSEHAQKQTICALYFNVPGFFSPLYIGKAFLSFNGYYVYLILILTFIVISIAN